MLDVASDNDAPIAGNDTFQTNEDVELTGNVITNDSDVDGDVLEAVTVIEPENGTVELNADGTFTYTPNTNFFGADSFTYEVTDGNGGTDQATVTISVGSVNDAPVAVDDNFSTCLLYTSPSPRDRG